MGSPPAPRASLPEADDQSGTIVIRSAGEVALRVEQRLHARRVDRDTLAGLMSAAPGRDTDEAVDQALEQQISYRYDPARDASPSATLPASLRLSRGGQAWRGTQGVVWQSRLTSQYEASGAASHRYTLHIENPSQSRLALNLPVAIRDVQATVDGQPAPVQMLDDQLTAPLPPLRRFLVVELTYRTAEAPLGAWAERTAPLLKPDFPVLNQHWIAYFPQEYDVALTSPDWSGSASPPGTGDVACWGR